MLVVELNKGEAGLAASDHLNRDLAQRVVFEQSLDLELKHRVRKP